jgi:glyoxylase-like metal-dependent hydrolase (beta-lactamase superfamily II)
MADYLRSLTLLLGRDDARYLPTHGPAIEDPKPLVAAFIAHRRAREQQILECLASGPATIQAMVPQMYAAIAKQLYPAAARSVFAHMLHMLETGAVATDAAPTLTATYRLP